MNSDKKDRQSLATYADEVLCANWHPLVLMLAEPPARVPKAVLDPEKAGDLLARLYVDQRA